MENSIKPQKLLSQRIAEFLFTIYLITLYIFVDREETVIISKVVFIIYAAFTIIAVLRSKSLHIGKSVMSVYIAFTWMFATIFWAENAYNATVMMKTIWQIFILFFLTYNLFAKQKNSQEYLLKSLYIAGIVLILYSIYVYGFSEIINVMTKDKAVRLGREINQENTFGMMNAITVLVAFYYFFYKKSFKVVHLTTIVAAFFLAMSSGSRKALLMVFMGILLMVFKKYSWKKLYKIVVTAAVLVVVFAVVIQLPMLETVRERMEGLISFFSGDGIGDASTSTRMSMIKEGWSVFKERLVIGFGANNYKNVTRFSVYSHNNFIEVLVDFGLLGFALYYFIYFNCLKNLWKSKNDAGKALFSIFMVRFILEIAYISYYEKLHWVLMAFFLLNPEKEEKEEKETSPTDDLELEEADLWESMIKDIKTID